MPDEAEIELRCTCRRQPLLGVAGRGTDGKPFVHVLKMKGGYVEVEVIITEGRAYITCRECGRRLRINIKTETVESRQERLPSEIRVS